MATPAITYVAIDGKYGNQPYSESRTQPAAPLGLEAAFKDVQTGTANAGAAVAVYCRGSNVTAAGQFVHIVNGSAVLLDSANSSQFWPIGIAGAALSATNVYGWVGVVGKFDNAAFTNVSYPASARMYFGTVAGQVHPVSASAVGSRIQNLVCPVTYTSADTYGTVQLWRPFVQGLTASN